MNDLPPTPPPEFSVRRTLNELKDLARREPAKAIAAAVGVGLFINLLPPRLVASTVSVVGATLVRPILLTLGVTKVIELYQSKIANPTPHEPVPSPSSLS